MAFLSRSEKIGIALTMLLKNIKQRKCGSHLHDVEMGSREVVCSHTTQFAGFLQIESFVGALT